MSDDRRPAMHDASDPRFWAPSREDVVRFLAAKNAEDCAACKTQSPWIYDKDASSANIQIISAQGGQVIADNQNVTRPLLLLTCYNCADTRFIATGLVTEWIKDNPA